MQATYKILYGRYCLQHRFFSNNLSGETQIQNNCSRICQAANYVSLLWVLLLGCFFESHKRWLCLSWLLANKHKKAIYQRSKSVNESDVGGRERLQESLSHILAAAAGGAANLMPSCLADCGKVQPGWWHLLLGEGCTVPFSGLEINSSFPRSVAASSH